VSEEPGGTSVVRAISYRWVVLGAATLAQASASFVIQGLGALTGFLQSTFSLNGTAVGVLVTAAALAPIAVMLKVGDLLDRRHEGTILLGGALLMVAGVAGAGLAPNYPLLLAGLFVAGAGYSTVQPGGSKAVAQYFSTGRRGLAMGIRQAGLPVGGAVAAAILPVVAHSYGWRCALTLAAVVVGGGGLVFYTAYRRPPPDMPNQQDAMRLSLRARVAEALQYRWLRPVIYSGITLVTAQFAIQTYLMLFLRDIHHIQLTRAAWVLVVVQVAGGAGRILLAAFSDGPDRTRRGPIIASMLATASLMTGLPLLSASTSLPPLFIFAAFLGFFAFGWYGPWVVHITEAAPSCATGLLLSVAMTANQIAIAATPPLLGFLHDISGDSYLVLWWVPSAAILLAIPSVLRAQSGDVMR
jgi:predicted MFS family arabinose efflux permease